MKKHILMDIPVLGPILAAALSFVVFGEISVNLAKLIMPDSEVFSDVMLILGSLAALLVHKLWFRGEFEGCLSSYFGSKRILSVILVVFVIETVADIAGLFVGVQKPTLLTLTMSLDAGFCEETFFRGIPISVAMKNCNSKKGLYATLIVTSIIFGFAHCVNLKGNADIAGTILQVIFSLCGGLFFSSTYLVTGNLLIPIAIHSIHDFIAFSASNVSTDGIITSISSMDIVTGLIVAIADLIGCMLLIKGHEDEILALWRKLWNKE